MNPRSLSFAHLSDPHLSDLADVPLSALLSKRILGYLSWRQRRRHEHLAAVLDALRLDLRDRAPDQILITGDLTHLGLPDEFRQVRTWLEALDHPAVAVVPGNHDSYVAAPWASSYRLWQPYFGRDADDQAPRCLDDIFPTLTVRGPVAFIGVSSARPSLPLLAGGSVGPRQRDRVATLLAECGAKGLFRVVFLHHPPLPGQEPWRKSLWDGEDLLAVIAARGAELVLHGHSHRASASQMVAGGRAIPVLGVSSASARGGHGPPALYNRLVVTEGADGWLLEVESREYRAGRGFAPQSDFSLTVPR